MWVGQIWWKISVASCLGEFFRNCKEEKEARRNAKIFESIKFIDKCMIFKVKLCNHRQENCFRYNFWLFWSTGVVTYAWTIFIYCLHLTNVYLFHNACTWQNKVHNLCCQNGVGIFGIVRNMVMSPKVRNSSPTRWYVSEASQNVPENLILQRSASIFPPDVSNSFEQVCFFNSYWGIWTCCLRHMNVPDDAGLLDCETDQFVVCCFVII